MAEFAPVRTPMYDARGNMNRPWLVFFNSLSGSSSGAAYFEAAILDGSAITIDPPVSDAQAGAVFILHLDQDATGARSAPTFAAGFASSIAAQIAIDGTPSTRTSLVFVFDGSIWSLVSQMTGAATT